jgi:methyl-accepting chemotaxis protein
MLDSLRGIITSVRGAASHVSDAAEEILTCSREQEHGITEQSASLEEMSRTMTALADTAKAIAGNADGLTQLADQMSSNVQTGQKALGASQASMKEIVEQNKIVADRMNKLYEQSQSIISVIDIIDNISDRLDLLALNAALEGSRAGEIGKGFSLVAQEMRRLAENVSGSTKEIKETVQEIHRYTQACLDASHQGGLTTMEGAREVDKMVDVMKMIFSLIEDSTDSARQITAITQQQLSSSEQMVTSMQEVATVSQQGKVAAQNVTLAVSALATISARMGETVSVFSLSSEADVGPEANA